MSEYLWDEEKNRKLKYERGLGFESIIEAIREGNVVDDFPHPNPRKYPHQRMMVIIIDEYAYLVPYIDDSGTLVLKTVIPSRKATRKYRNKMKEEKL